MKKIKELIVVFSASLMLSSIATAQSDTLKNLSLSAEVEAGGISSLTVLNGATVTFNDGSALRVGLGEGTGGNRFTSSTVELSYVVQSLAAGQSWALKIYTTGTDGLEGLVDGNNTMPLKFNLANVSGVFSDIGPDANWSGNAATYSFVTDIGAAAVSTLTDSEETGAAGYNPSLKFQFGTDAAGAVATAVGDTYSAVVTVELSVE